MRTHTFRRSPVLIAAVIGTAVLIPGLAPTSALADDTDHVAPIAWAPIAWAPIGIYPRPATSWASGRVGPALAPGTPVHILCEEDGQAVSSDAGTSTIWDRIAEPAGSWIPNVFLDTGYPSWTPGVERCADYDARVAQQQQEQDDPLTSEGRYDRAAAAAWARANAKQDSDGSYFPHRYGDNCTWFVSNALWNGGIPRTAAFTDRSRDVGNLASRWDVVFGGPTKTATVAARQRDHLVTAGLATSAPTEVDLSSPIVPGAKLGDLLAYDWDPGDTADGFVDHAMIITGFDASGSPLVSGQTNDVVDQQWQHASSGRLIVDTKKVVRAYLVHIIW